MSETINAPAATETAPAKVKRPAVTKRTWLDAIGGESNDPREAVGLRIEVVDAGNVEIRSLTELGVEDANIDEAEEVIERLRKIAPVINACALFGLNIVLTNTMGGLKGDDALEAMLQRYETLGNGEWTSRKGAEGPRISQLVQAVFNIFQRSGKDTTLEQITETIKGKTEDQRKELSARKDIQAELAQIRAEAARKRAEELAKKAGGDAAGAEGELTL